MDFESIPNIVTSNRFTILNSAFAQTVPNTTPPQETSAPKSSSANKPKITENVPLNRRTLIKTPPIYVTNFSHSASAFEKNLAELCGKTFKLKLLKEGIRIQFDNLESHNKLISFLKENNFSYFTFTLNSEKILSLVLRGLPPTPTQDIEYELRSKGLNPTSCSQIGKSPGNPIYRINFPAGTSLNSVSKVGYIFSMRVYWDKFYSHKNFTQCFRCQAFGHSATNCNLAPKCIKCAGDHHTTSCTKTKEVPPTCANCTGSHTANYSKCPSLLSYLSFKEKKNPRPANPVYNNPLSEMPREHPVPTPNFSRPCTSFADVVKNNFDKNNTQTPPFTNNLPYQPTGDVSDINELFIAVKELKSLVDISMVLSVVKTLNQKLKLCRTNAEKVQVFMTVLSKLD